MGSELHNKIVICRLENDMFVGSSIVIMHAKCGLLSDAWDVFKKLRGRGCSFVDCLDIRIC